MTALDRAGQRWTAHARTLMRRIMEDFYDDGIGDVDVAVGRELLVIAKGRLPSDTNGLAELQRLVVEADSDDGVSADTMRAVRRWLGDDDRRLHQLTNLAGELAGALDGVHDDLRGVREALAAFDAAVTAVPEHWRGHVGDERQVAVYERALDLSDAIRDLVGVDGHPLDRREFEPERDERRRA